MFCLAIFSGFEQRQYQVADHQPSVALAVATSKYISSTPLFIANRQGFFRQEGLAVRLVINNAGTVADSPLLAPLRSFILGLTLLFWATATWWEKRKGKNRKK